MIFIFKIAFRNICRHKRRSFVNGLLIFVSASVVFASNIFCKTINTNMNTAVVDSCTGDLQIHSSEQEDLDIYSSPPADTLLFNKADEAINVVKDVDGVERLTERLRVQGLFMTSDESTSSVLTGVYPEIEKDISPKIKIVSGTYITQKNGMIVGQTLQKKMSLKVGDTIQYYINGSDEAITQLEFVVEGIFMSDGLGMYMDTYSFCDLNYLRKCMKYQNNEVTEIVIQAKDGYKKANIISDIQKLMDEAGYNLTVKKWEDVSETFSSVIVASTLLPTTFNIFVIFVVIFGLFNTIIINILERVKETSIMNALGTSRIRIVGMFFCEYLILGFISVVLAMCIEVPILLILGNVGIKATSEILAYIFGGYVLFMKIKSGIILVTIAMFTLIPALVAALVSTKNVNKLMLTKCN